MGYETKMMVVSSYGRLNKKKLAGYLKQEATLELGCVCYDKLGDLIRRLKDESKEVEGAEELRDEISAISKEYKAIYTDGDYSYEALQLTKKQREARGKKLCNREHRLGKKLPYVFEGSSNETYTDSYGDFLLVATLEEVLEAMVKDQAKSILKEEYESNRGYRRFALAIALLESFKSDFGDEVKVVLYGH